MPSSRHDGLFRALLRLFPSEFRGDFGDQMVEDFREQRQEATRGRRSIALLKLWARTGADLIRRAPREHLDVLSRDARYALRILRRRPASTATVVLSLAIGIGLNTALFSVVSGVLWRSLPFGQSERLVRLFEVDDKSPGEMRDATPGNFLDIQRETHAFDRMAAASIQNLTLVEPGEPEQLPVMNVSEGFFETLGAKPVLGRVFEHADYAASIASSQQPHRGFAHAKPTVVVISYDLWHRRFLGRPDVLGQRIGLAGGDSVEIVGVMGPDMASFDSGRAMSPQWWLPEAPDPTQRRSPILVEIGRLAPGVSVRTAQAELDVISGDLAAAFPASNRGRSFRAEPLLDTIVKDVRGELTFLFGAVLCVLLVTCVNVVHLFLANASGRRVELATRVALGATRGHLVRQTLTESALLAAIGGAGGLLLAAWAMPALVAMAPAGIPRLHEIRLDWSALAFTAVASTGVALLCGVAASLSLTMLTPWTTLGSTRTAGSLQGRRVRRALVVCEVAVALMLVVASMLMVRTVRSLGALNLGFDPSRVVSVEMPLPFAPLSGGLAPLRQIETSVIEQVRNLPGVTAAGVGASPLRYAMGMTGLVVPGNPRDFGFVIVQPVSTGYFEALGARLVGGRFFGADDRADASGVAIVNETAARMFWPAGSALGQTIVMNKTTPVQVVGIVGNMRGATIEAEPGPALFQPHVQSQSFMAGTMLVRTDRDPQTLLPAIRSITRGVNPQQPFRGAEPLQERIDAATAPRRFILRLVAIFSMLGLALAVIGIYGVLAESVAERVPEIGVRMALGASASDVLILILRQGASIVAFGIGLGLAGAFLFHGEMHAMVFGVRTLDPVAYVTACGVLAIAAFVACAIPARRAARLDPVAALRAD